MSARSLARRPLPAPAPGVSSPADRNYRRSDPRLTRRRRAGQVLRRAVRVLAGPAVLLSGLAWAIAAIAGSPWLQVNHLVVRGNARLSVAEVEALAAGLRNENILRVDVDQYRRRIMESPWVAAVSMSRVLPGTIEIGIVERTPFAIGRLGQQLYLVDPSGLIIDAYGPQYREYDLPIVDGLIQAPGDASTDPVRLDTTARLLAALAARDDLRTRVSQIDVSNPRDAVVLLGDDPARLHLGDTDFVDRLQTWLDVGSTLRDQLADIDYVDLRFGGQLFVARHGRRAGGEKGTKD